MKHNNDHASIDNIVGVIDSLDNSLRNILIWLSKYES